MERYCLNLIAAFDATAVAFGKPLSMGDILTDVTLSMVALPMNKLESTATVPGTSLDAHVSRCTLLEMARDASRAPYTTQRSKILKSWGAVEESADKSVRDTRTMKNELIESYTADDIFPAC